MAEDLFPEKGDDDRIWLTSMRFGTAVAVCREVDGEWYAAEDDSFYGEVGPFDSLETLANHVELNRLFSPWGSPGN
ncbi:hypothetical protein N9Y00_10015 [Tateyamaria sp.]|jgi:hypothetical protein|nr:hypothetical protein [Tateyamaria sp.]